MVRHFERARGRACLLLVLLFPLLMTVPTAEAATAIERVSFSHRPDGAGLIVRIHTADPIQAFREPVQTRNGIEIVIFNAEMADSYRLDDPLAPVRAVRADPMRGHLRLTFSLDSQVQVKATAFRDRATSDLLLGLEFVTDTAQPLPVANLPEPRIKYPGTNVSSQPAASETPAYDTAAMRWRLDTIVIDAGHGGHDHGAVHHGIREKDICLAVAGRLGALIEKELGVRVVHTRTSDRFVELKERGRIANDAGGKLFISLHANAAPSARATGTETFFLGTHKSEAARDVMERENSVIQLESDPTQYRGMTDESLILQTLAYSAFMRKSEELASLVEDAMATGTRKSRGVKQAGFYVLWSASMPAILVEMGFISNQNEATYLASARGQEHIANAILRAVESFKERYERDLHLVSP